MGASRQTGLSFVPKLNWSSFSFMPPAAGWVSFLFFVFFLKKKVVVGGHLTLESSRVRPVRLTQSRKAAAAPRGGRKHEQVTLIILLFCITWWGVSLPFERA